MTMQDLHEGIEIIWSGSKGLDEVVLNLADSTLQMTDKLSHAVDEARRQLDADPNKQVGQLWRYESFDDGQNWLVIEASHTDYAVHDVLRKTSNQQRGSYALPIGVNPLLELTEGTESYILLGLINEESDHPGLALAGSTFIYRQKNEGIKEAIIRGVTTKSTIGMECVTNHLDAARIIGLVYTEDTHDVGIVTHIPIDTRSTGDIQNGGNYSRVLFLPNHTSAINELIKTGKFEDHQATDQLRGSLFAYQKGKA